MKNIFKNNKFKLAGSSRVFCMESVWYIGYKPVSIDVVEILDEPDVVDVKTTTPEKIEELVANGKIIMI